MKPLLHRLHPHRLIMSDEYQPIDRRRRAEHRPMDKERRLALPPGRKLHAFIFKEVLMMRLTQQGYVLHMANGEIRIIPEAQMAALARQHFLTQVVIVEPGKPACSGGGEVNGDDVHASKPAG